MMFVEQGLVSNNYRQCVITLEMSLNLICMTHPKMCSPSAWWWVDGHWLQSHSRITESLNHRIAGSP